MSTSHSTRPPGAAPGTEAGQTGLQQIPAARAGGPQVSPGEAGTAWPAFLAAGIAALVVGVLLLAWPSETLTLVAILIGISLIVAGLMRLIQGFAGHQISGAARAGDVVIGLIAIVVGLYCLKHPNFTITTLAIIVGIFWVIYGIADLAAGLSSGPVPGRGLMIATGVLSLLAGLIVMFWPTISLTVLVAVMGIWLLVYGVALTVMAFQLRRAGHSAGGGPGSMAAA